MTLKTSLEKKTNQFHTCNFPEMTTFERMKLTKWWMEAPEFIYKEREEGDGHEEPEGCLP